MPGRVLLIGLMWLALMAPARAGAPEELASLIDRHLAAFHEQAGIVAAPAASDAEFFRRLSLDLVGRIPAPADVIAFLDDTQSDKRSRAIDSLLASPEHAAHFSRIWRSLLLPEADSDRQLAYFRTGLEVWLRQERQRNVPFDELTRGLVAAPITGTPEQPQFVLTDLNAPNPIAFVASKDDDPAKIAAASLRLFLGLRLECAQCHDHPFDHFTREQFWNQAAFFQGIARRGKGAFAPVLEDRTRRSAAIPLTELTVPVRFLSGESPVIPDGESPRVSFAAWMTAADNPYFARAAVNRVWGQLMGQGLVDPVDDFGPGNTPSHPQLLSDLAAAFIASGHDLNFLYRGICLSQAYQRTSRRTHPSQEDAAAFAAMAVKAMSAEQFYDCLVLATRDAPAQDAPAPNPAGDRNRRRMLDLFAAGETRDPQTALPQALALMNGSFISRAADPAGRNSLMEVLESTGSDPAQLVEQLYLRTLSRRPDPDESRICADFLMAEGDSGRSQRAADLLWTLLNSPEFRWNH